MTFDIRSALRSLCGTGAGIAIGCVPIGVLPVSVHTRSLSRGHGGRDVGVVTIESKLTGTPTCSGPQRSCQRNARRAEWTIWKLLIIYKFATAASPSGRSGGPNAQTSFFHPFLSLSLPVSRCFPQINSIAASAVTMHPSIGESRRPTFSFSLPSRARCTSGVLVLPAAQNTLTVLCRRTFDSVSSR